MVTGEWKQKQIRVNTCKKTCKFKDEQIGRSNKKRLIECIRLKSNKNFQKEKYFERNKLSETEIEDKR